MGTFRASLDLPYGWMDYVERGEIVYYSSPMGFRFFSKEDVYKHLTDQKNNYFGQSLLDAIYKGENEKVSKLLVGVNVEKINQSFVTEWFLGQALFPLQVGCMVNNWFAVDKLLNIPHVNVNVRNQDGMTPIMNAALNCSRKVLRMMLSDERVDLYGENNDGKGLEQLVNGSEKHEAVRAKCLEMIEQAKIKRKESKSEQVTVIEDDEENDSRERENKIESKRRMSPAKRSQYAKRRRIGRDVDLVNQDQNHDYQRTLYNLKCIRRSLNSLAKYDIQNVSVNEIDVDDEEDDVDETDVDKGKEEVFHPINEKTVAVNEQIAHPVNVQISKQLNAQAGQSLDDVRANIRKHYIEQIDRANVEKEEVEKRLNMNIDRKERKKLSLKEKYSFQQNTLATKSNKDKVKLEQKKSKLEQELAELQQNLAHVRQDLTEMHQKVQREDQEIQTRYEHEITTLESDFEKENEESIQSLSYLNEKTKQLAKDLEKMVDVENYDNNASSNLEAAKETLECPICMEMMSPPTRIWMCPSSHLVCEPCKDQLLQQPCPTCRIHRVTLRAFIAEKFAQTLFNNK